MVDNYLCFSDSFLNGVPISLVIAAFSTYYFRVIIEVSLKVAGNSFNHLFGEVEPIKSWLFTHILDLLFNDLSWFYWSLNAYIDLADDDFFFFFFYVQ